jgi:hypothetical protein
MDRWIEVKNDEALASGDERFKVWPTDSDRDAFRLVMQADGPPPGSADDPANTIQEAYAFFAEQMRTWLGSGDVAPEQVAARCEALRVGISELIHVVAITIEGGDDPQMIFETLNARGTPLLAMDLVKNATFMRLTLAGSDTARLHDDVWHPELGQDYWREEVGRGRLARPRAELFLLHWLTMKLGRTVPVRDLFPTFRSRVLDAPGAPPPDEVLEELCRDAGVMRSFDEIPPDTEAGRFFRILDALDTTVFHPLALLLFRTPEIPLGRRDRALHALESYLIRRMLLGLSTRGYSELGVELVSAALRDLDRVDEQVATQLSRSSAAGARWPVDAEVQQQVLRHPVFGYVSRQRLAMVLSEIELSLRGGPQTEDVALLDRTLSIEHILPRTWEETWPIPDPTEERIERRLSLVDVLGNLTIITGSLNSGLSNQPWGQKRERLTRHSVLRLNQEVAGRDEWDEQAILDRGNWLGDRIVTMWPGPEQFDPSFSPDEQLPPEGETSPEFAEMPANEVAEAYGEGSELFRALLEELARHPGERRTYANVEAALGWERRRLAAVLGGYGNLASRYNGRRPYRIFQESDGTWWIWMDHSRAQVIRGAESASPVDPN